jgi:NAD(P)-dependent dehydrogenase (short-subunit alcohol dehydrogenase family)
VQQRFDGATVLVTGAASGIGHETAVRFALEGADVLITGRSIDRLDSAIASAADRGTRLRCLVADVKDEAQVAAAVAEAARPAGRLDVLFNNAGGGGQGKPLAEIDAESFDEVMATHARGIWLGMKHAIPVMIRGGGGAIVNMSSMAGLVGVPVNAEYTAAMWAVIGLTKAATMDYGGQGIRVNAVCPGAHETEMVEATRARFPGTEWNERVRRVYPRGRIGDPSEVAETVLFLASPAASNVYGIALPVDGGFTAQ